MKKDFIRFALLLLLLVVTACSASNYSTQHSTASGSDNEPVFIPIPPARASFIPVEINDNSSIRGSLNTAGVVVIDSELQPLSESNNTFSTAQQISVAERPLSISGFVEYYSKILDYPGTNRILTSTLDTLSDPTDVYMITTDYPTSIQLDARAPVYFNINYTPNQYALSVYDDEENLVQRTEHQSAEILLQDSGTYYIKVEALLPSVSSNSANYRLVINDITTFSSNSNVTTNTITRATLQNTSPAIDQPILIRSGYEVCLAAKNEIVESESEGEEDVTLTKAYTSTTCDSSTNNHVWERTTSDQLYNRGFEQCLDHQTMLLSACSTSDINQQFVFDNINQRILFKKATAQTDKLEKILLQLSPTSDELAASNTGHYLMSPIILPTNFSVPDTQYSDRWVSGTYHGHAINSPELLIQALPIATPTIETLDFSAYDSTKQITVTELNHIIANPHLDIRVELVNLDSRIPVSDWLSVTSQYKINNCVYNYTSEVCDSSDTQPQSEKIKSEVFTVNVDRGNLLNGIYRGQVVLHLTDPSDADAEITPLRFNVRMQVIRNNMSDIGSVYVFAISQARPNTVYTKLVPPQNGAYHFSFSQLPAGTYRLFASTDLDSDLFGCSSYELCGSGQTITFDGENTVAAEPITLRSQEINAIDIYRNPSSLNTSP